MLDLFLANSRRGWGSSETAVVALPVLTPFSLPKSLCYRLMVVVVGGVPLVHPACFASAAMPAVVAARNVPACLRRGVSGNGATRLAHS